jgi:hypothetical protein
MRKRIGGWVEKSALTPPLAKNGLTTNKLAVAGFERAGAIARVQRSRRRNASASTSGSLVNLAAVSSAKYSRERDIPICSRKPMKGATNTIARSPSEDSSSPECLPKSQVRDKVCAA